MLGDDNEVVIDGDTHDLITPSQQESGTKLNINADIEEDATYTLLIDFDASRSIVETGNGQYILKPVVRAVSLVPDLFPVPFLHPTFRQMYMP